MTCKPSRPNHSAPPNRRATWSRRDTLRIGSLSAFGLGLTDWVRCRMQAEDKPTSKTKSCILLWLDGGPSHLETFDVKPDAPSEVRGPFRSISTSVSGIQICELLSSTAKVADKLTIVRSLTSPLGEHGLANQYLLTGYKPSPVIDYPSFGSVVASESSANAVLPDYVAIPEARSAGAGFLGQSYEPFEVGGDPSQSNYQVRDLEFFPEVDAQRIARRRAYLQAFDRAQSLFESSSQLTAIADANPVFEQAYRLATSPMAKTAFNLDSEPHVLRERYGRRIFGQSCLMARRLVERGVPFVTVTNTGWDTHDDLELSLKHGYSGAKVGVGLIPTFDQAFATLIDDLSQRGLLDTTLVLAMGEFGRTPKLNTRGGRDHWPRVFSMVMAGGGLSGGQVIGASDRFGESPEDLPITPTDLAFTIYKLLGVEPGKILMTPDGRPVQVNQGGKLIPGLGIV